MADKETGLNIVVGAVADEGSAKKATKDIVNAVGKVSKGGRIDITIPIDVDKSKLTNAQKEVVKEIEKLTSKGVSASGKDIDKLTSKFNEFTKAFDGAGKGRQNKLFKEIRRQVEELQAQYKALKPAREATTTKRHSTKKTPTSVDLTTDRRRGSTRGVNRMGSTSPKGYPTFTGADPSRTTSRMLHLSEYSPHGSIGAYIQAKHVAEEEKRTKKSLIQWTDKGYQPRKGRATTEAEYNQHIATKALQDLGETLHDIENGVVDITKEMLVDQLGIIRDTFSKSGKDLEATSIAIKNIMEARYSDNANKHLGGTSGKEKGVGPGHELAKETQKFIYDLWDKVLKATNPTIIYAKRFATEVAESAKIVNKANKKLKDNQRTANSQYEKNKTTSRQSEGYQELQKLASDMKTGTDAVKTAVDSQSNVANQHYIQDVHESSREESSDRAEGKKNSEIIAGIQEDASTGFNSDEKANEAIKAMMNSKGIDMLKDMMNPCETILQSILSEIQLIKENGITTKNKKGQGKTEAEAGLIPYIKQEYKRNVSRPGKDIYGRNVVYGGKEVRTKAQDKTNLGPTIKFGLNEIEEQAKYARVMSTKVSTDVETKIQKAISDHVQNLQFPPDNIPRSEITTSIKDPAKWYIRLKDNFADLIGITARYKKILASTSDEQDELAAKQIKERGFDRNRNITGSKVSFAYRVDLWKNKEELEKVFQNLKITDGVKIDTTEVTDKLGKVLTGRQMRNAQMGGSPLRNLLGYATGFIGMPSIEKSRAGADALNQVNANIREALNNVIANIEDQESALAGMEKRGDLKLDKEGNVLEDSTPEAKALATELENSKIILDTILADMKEVDATIDKSHGNIGRILKNLSFTSPVLRKNNAIIANINAGYDKSGKALRFQKRTAEILNYSFQLMSRHIGQMFRNLVLSLNPLNMIRKAFTEFQSYNTKWQRTMNVVKYNLHAILEPFMDKIAQFLINCIGFVDIISMKVQKAFGYMPISLFDQAAADSQKIKEELEAAANVTAGFDELHDIGSDNSGANDLLGSIYKPQLSESWKKLAEEIGDLFAGLITGDLGFGEVMKRILQILWDGLKAIAKTIWDWFKTTAIGKYITQHWKEILDRLLRLFLAWQLLKIAGKLLWGALTGQFTGTAFGELLGNLGTKFMDIFTSTQFGSDFVRGIKAMFTSGGMIGTFKMGGASLGTIFAQALVAVVGVAIAGIAIGVGGSKMKKNTAYNEGIDSVGGDDKDKKSNVGAAIGTTLGTTAGLALTGLAIGGPIGAAIGAGIGAIAGILTTVLAPAIEKNEIAARNMNNELQKIEYYEGAVQGAQSQVDELDEMMQVLNDTLQKQTDKVYKEGDALGINRTRIDELVQSVQNGTFNTGMLTGAEIGLKDSLEQLSWQQEHNKEASDKLTEAKRKLEKAELDLAIAEDIEAGNFEMAAARVEYALASELYETDEAVKKMTQIMKKGSAEQQAAMLKDMSPEMKKNFNNYYTTTEGAMDELYKLYDKMSEKERETWLQNINGEIAANITSRMETIRQRVENSSWWQQLLDFNKNGKILGISYIGHDIPGYAVGTNYVPNDGLAYLHQGEAVIPKKYNQPYQSNSSGLENAIGQLSQQVAQIRAKVDDGIAVRGQFIQRGSDLVATVQKANNKLSNNVLNNKVYAR